MCVQGRDGFYHSLVLYMYNIHHMPCSSASFMVSVLLSTLYTFISAHEWISDSLCLTWVSSRVTPQEKHTVFHLTQTEAFDETKTFNQPIHMQTLIHCLCEEAFVGSYHAKQSPVASENLTRLYDPYELYIQCWALKPRKPSPRGAASWKPLCIRHFTWNHKNHIQYMPPHNTHTVLLSHKSTDA